MSGEKTKILVVGSGGVGTMAAYALESGGKATVTAVLRSNYDAVVKNGFEIDSIEHGHDIKGFRPSESRCAVLLIISDANHPLVTKAVPNVSNGKQRFDFVVVTTKNIPDVKPSVVDIIEASVTPGHTAILLLQNGFNIEKPVIQKFPTNPILSGISMIGATEFEKGKIRHDGPDVVKIGAFISPQVSQGVVTNAAKHFVELYSACGKVDCHYDDDVRATRWRKLIYNACWNSVATILRMDTSRMRFYEHVVDNLVLPTMKEIQNIAAADGVTIPDELLDYVIRVDPIDTYFKPSMCQDIEKGNYIEHEVIVGEPLREAKRLGVQAPLLTVIYGILKGLQTKTMEEKGLIEPKFLEDAKYK